jgi:dGTPase
VARVYTATDTERFVPESHSSKRSDFARDRGRLLHSSALRRLAAKTQVLSPTAGLDFARNRLTHSLEVAQIGRELANRVGVDADVVETACLAHDIGHPPFGHNGEKALSDWAADSGGFEGNAQTFRLLVRLEPKVVDSRGVPRGLNLTRASLLASMKYPWGAEASETDASGREKFGVYDDDREVFDWVRNGMQGRQLSLEAQIMDFSDDVAYSVHDFEDAVVNGYVDPRMLVAHSHRDEVVHSMLTYAAGGNVEALRVAWDRLSSVPGWVTDFDARRSGLASLKNLTSTLIGRFAESSSVIAGETLHVPEGTAAEIAVLKGIVSHHVMSHTARQPIYLEQRGQLSALATRFYNNPNELDPVFALDWAQAGDTDAKARVVVDQVASLTDQSALALHQRLCS